MLVETARPVGRGGFTLVEILIVVAILGILAGMVLPQYWKHSASARASALLTDLQTIRRALQGFEVEHRGRHPSLAQMWDSLTGQTGPLGNPGPEFGPYLITAPVNPFTQGSACAADNSADWEYDSNKGTIRAVVPASTIAEFDLDPMDVVTAP